MRAKKKRGTAHPPTLIIVKGVEEKWKEKEGQREKQL